MLRGALEYVTEGCGEKGILPVMPSSVSSWFLDYLVFLFWLL